MPSSESELYAWERDSTYVRLPPYFDGMTREPGAVPDVLFEPSGRLLLPYLSNAEEWPTDLPTWERFACRVAGRDLTPQEWHALLPNRAYQHVCPA